MALGFGFRCGFLGLLHLEIIQERLEREYNLDLVTTAPGVIYKVHKTNGEVIDLTNPSNMPDPSEIEYMEEPMVSAEIMVTTEFVGPIMKLCQERRGIYNGMEYIEQTRALLKYDLPLNEIIYDFFDALKSRSRGYASFDYEMKGYERSSLVKLDILINKEEVDALSFIVFSGNAVLNFALTTVRSWNVNFDQRLIRIGRKNVLQQVGAEVVSLKPAAEPVRIKQTNGFHSPDRVKKSVE